MEKKKLLYYLFMLLFSYTSYSADLTNIENTEIIQHKFSYKLPDGTIRNLNRQIRIKKINNEQQCVEIIKSKMYDKATIELTIRSNAVENIALSLTDLYGNYYQKEKIVELAKGNNIVLIKSEKIMQGYRIILTNANGNYKTSKLIFDN